MILKVINQCSLEVKQDKGAKCSKNWDESLGWQYTREISDLSTRWQDRGLPWF